MNQPQAEPFRQDVNYEEYPVWALSYHDIGRWSAPPLASQGLLRSFLWQKLTLRIERI
jgi:hypothetical protein